MQTLDYAAVPGVAECALDPSLLADLPVNDAPAPWDCELTAVTWWGRGGPSAARASGVDGRALAVVAGLVSYSHTPVGAYREVYGAVGHRRGRGVVGTIPFMAVDSRRSLVGGRGNWSLPKCLAEFDGEPGAGEMTARGNGWSVRARVRPFGPTVPVRTTATIEQPWPDGRRRRSRLVGKARAQAAVVHVDVESDGSLGTWLRSGRHLGAVLSQTRFALAEAR